MKQIAIYLFITISLFFLSCKKYLNEKPDVKLAIPTALTDFQILLNYPTVTKNSTSGILDLGSDDYYLDLTTYQSLNPRNRSCYTWESEIWHGANSADWFNPYANIYIANVVMEGLDKYQVSNAFDQETRNYIYGEALFIRAFEHYALEETFGQPYKPASANEDLGIPIKLTSNLSTKVSRSSTRDVFAQIIKDLDQALSLLPNSISARNRTSKATVFAMLARVYLTMQDYERAGVCADSSLNINDSLFNFNNLTVSQISSPNPFSSYFSPNDFIEVLYPSTQVNYNVVNQSTSIIDSTLYNAYDSNDLRKIVFFQKNALTNTWYFKGYYSGNKNAPFSGPAIDEMYLIRAECFARSGNKKEALASLNALVSQRCKNTVLYSNIDAIDAEEALRKILLERRKELLFRGLRWSDLRRLNQDPRFKMTLKRNLNGQIYTLTPNDPRYTYPIPDSEIRLSGIQQNPR